MHTHIAITVAVLIAISGCGGPRPVSGGTEGTLRVAGVLLSETQVTVHQLEAGIYRPIGFAVTDSDGALQLVTNGARGPLRLTQGEYRCTLESAGAPVQFPKEFAQPQTTPLKVSWSESDRELDLQVSGW